MYIIKPLTIDPTTEVMNLSVPMDDVYPAWDALLLYQQGDIVVTGAGETQKIWEARHSVVTPIDQSSSLPNLYNQGMDPLQTNVVGRNNDGSLVANATEYNYFGEGWWRDATDDKYLANRYRMFDPNPAFYTESDVSIVFTIKPTGIWSGVALFNVVADSITITLNGGPESYTATRNLRFDPILSQEFQNEPQVAFIDLPLIDSDINVNATLTVELSVSSPRYQRIGYFCIGETVEVGKASYGVTTELMDFSRFERDVFGNVFTIRRGYSDKITYPYVVKAADLVQVRQILVARRATLTAYVGHPDVPLTITYGYFIDLDIPIDNWGQSDASIVVESVLYDTPGSTEDLPNVIEFIDPTLECVEETLGRVLEVCLKNGRISEQATASITDIVIDPTDVVDWELIWVVGTSEILGISGFITTGCDQYLPTFTWPDTVPVEHLPAIALIKATVTKVDGTVINLEPATLIISDSCSGGTGDCDGCYDTPVIDSHGWYDPSYVEPDPPDPDVHAYSLAELTETVEFEAAEIPAEGLEISGCAGETKYYWSDTGCYNGYIAVAWGVSVSGDGAYALDTFIEHGSAETVAIPTDESELEIVGDGRINRPTWAGVLRLLLKVNFISDCDSALLDTGATCGLPMNMDGAPFIGIPILPGEPETVIPLDPPEDEDQALYVVEVDLDEGDIFDHLDISVDGDATAYISVDSIPTVDDYDIVLTGTQTGSLSDFGIGADSTVLVLVVGASGTQTTLTVTPVVIQAQTLTIASTTHGQTATSPALEAVPPNVELVIASATHGQTADAITLTDVSTCTLEPQSASHGHTASSITLIQHHVLEIQSATHGQTADNLWLGELTRIVLRVAGDALRDSEGNILRDSEGNVLRDARKILRDSSGNILRGSDA